MRSFRWGVETARSQPEMEEAIASYLAGDLDNHNLGIVTDQHGRARGILVTVQLSGGAIRTTGEAATHRPGFFARLRAMFEPAMGEPVAEQDTTANECLLRKLEVVHAAVMFAGDGRRLLDELESYDERYGVLTPAEVRRLGHLVGRVEAYHRARQAAISAAENG